MPVYSYTARNAGGQPKTGTVEARTENAAVNILKNQGLFVVTLDSKRSSVVEQLGNIRGISSKDLVTFTRQLSTMISAGLPISRALEVLAAQTTNSRLKKITIEALRDIEGGATMSAALGRHDNVFPDTYRALVMAGEASGKLDEILLRLADTMEKQRELQSRFTAALIYPAIIFLAMIGVFVLMMLFVVPRLAEMYESLNVELPLPTQIMISISDFMTSRWYVVLIVVGIIVFGIKMFRDTPGGKAFFSKVSFVLPVFGRINKQKELTEFTRTLSLLVGAAIPIVEALNIVSRVTNNVNLREAALEAATNVEKGNPLSDYLRWNKNFPPILGQMVSVGEETGQLDEVLHKVAEFFAGETDHLVKGLSAALEPLILIMLGGMVGLLIVSIITPIYQITSAL